MSQSLRKIKVAAIIFVLVCCGVAIRTVTGMVVGLGDHRHDLARNLFFDYVLLVFPLVGVFGPPFLLLAYRKWKKRKV